MSDYLGSLVDRTLGLAPVVQPRLRSTFEPAARAPASDAVVPGDDTRMPAADASDTDHRGDAPAPAAAARSPQSDVEPPKRSRRMPMQATRETSAPPPFDDEPLLVDTARVERDERAPAPVRLVRDGNPRREHEADSIPPGRPNAGAPRPPPAVPPSGEKGADFSSSRPPAPVRDCEPDAASPPGEPPHPAIAGPRIQPQRVQAARPTSSRLESMDTSLPSAAPPSIHVTIGRVEVRAVLEQKGAARRAAPAPRETLEDYLQARRERKGRP